MPRWEADQIVSQSVLERLIDHDPKEPSDKPIGRSRSVSILKASLRRDLEWLLNSRRNPEATDDYEELEKSLFHYGLPDLNSLSWESGHDQIRLSKTIERVLTIFEPRLKRVKVTPIGEVSATQYVLRFQIEGLLEMEPSPERISFDTVLQLASGAYQVKGEPGV
jgi:type VI secretion system protein ImpF